MQEFRLALIQLAVTASKVDNLRRATEFIAEAAKNGAKLLSLPECCNSPYGNNFFADYAEEIPGESTQVFSKAALDNKVYLIAGSIPERKEGKLYNTSTVYSPDGAMIATHRKVHLFDIDIPGKITFQESKTLSPGNTLTTFDTSFCKVGLGICYDMRFAEMAQIYAQKGCQLMIYPGAFNMTTGPAHWELLARARAIDNQCYVACVSPARDTTASYIAWGHSSIVSPCTTGPVGNEDGCGTLRCSSAMAEVGEVIATTAEQEGIVYADIDLDYVEEVQKMIPVRNQRRSDLYEVKQLTS